MWLAYLHTTIAPLGGLDTGSSRYSIFLLPFKASDTRLYFVMNPFCRLAVEVAASTNRSIKVTTSQSSAPSTQSSRAAFASTS